MSLEQQLRDALSGTFRLERELGGGGMSRVFVAEETALGRSVALKVLTGLGDGVSADRFRREIQTIANLQHPHIVPLLSAGSAAATIWYTMPLVEGESLRSRLGRESRLGVRAAVQVARDVAEALAYAHRRGVIHRDIKPDNVLLTDGHAVVTDFGVAKALSASAQDGTLTSAGIAIGTPVYMAPEQVLADPAADHRVDLCLANLTAERTGPRPVVRSRQLTPWLVAALVIALIAAGFVLLRPDGAVAPDGPDRIAVIPFVPTDPADTSLARLGRDLVVTLTANLDNVGDLRMIDPLSVLAQTQGTGTRDPGRALAVAAGLGARSALVGSLVRSGGTILLDYRLVGTSGRADDPIARGTVTAPFADAAILTLTDSATWGMLETILPARDRQMPSFELLHTRSIPALRAFLDGENLILANRWADAEDAFARAIEEDSTFWFAYRRVFQAADWLFAAPRRAREDSIARAHRDGFPERERLLMEHDDHVHFGDHMAALAEVPRRFPDFWHGWFQWGDHMLHNGTRLLMSANDAAEAFDRALELNPRLAPALDHMILFQPDSGRVERAYAQLREQYGAAWDTVVTDYGLRAAVLYDLGLSRIRNDGRIDAAMLDTYVTELRTARSVPTLLDWTVAGPILVLDPQTHLEASRRVQSSGAPAPTRAAIRIWDGTAWAMRGAWDSALVSLDGLYEERPGVAFAGARYATGAMAYSTGALDREAAVSRRRELTEYRGTPAIMAAAGRLLAFLDGMVAHTDGNPAGIDSARAVLRAAQDDVSAAWLERALAAFQLDLQGNHAQAADSLVAIEKRRGGENVYDYFPLPFIRLAAGRIKAEEGQAAIADSLLSYYETGVATVSAQLVLRQTAGLASFERARAWDRAGDAGRAARFYREFLRLYDMPSARHRPYMEEAQSALAQLAGSADRAGARNP